ncbi:MAG: hypothetical protein AB7K64_00130 [Variibacter sp.]
MPRASAFRELVNKSKTLLPGHPDVAEVTVIRIPDQRWRETVLAVIVPRAGWTVILDVVRDHCFGKIGGFKISKCLEFLNVLPRNGAGRL